MRSTAFTLVELILVVGIILLLVALLLPVVVGSRQRAHMGQCINQLHQVGQAIHMYRSDHREYFPSKLVEVRSYVNEDGLFLCPADSGQSQGINRLIEGLPSSYLTILSELSSATRGERANAPDIRAAQILMDVDPNHGIAVCMLHGEKFAQLDKGEIALGAYKGLMLRLRVDASVQRIHIDTICVGKPGAYTETVYGWFIFTDAPCPSTVPQEALIISCPPRENIIPCE